MNKRTVEEEEEVCLSRWKLQNKVCSLAPLSIFKTNFTTYEKNDFLEKLKLYKGGKQRKKLQIWRSIHHNGSFFFFFLSPFSLHFLSFKVLSIFGTGEFCLAPFSRDLFLTKSQNKGDLSVTS